MSNYAADLHKWGPRPAVPADLVGPPCPACKEHFATGDYTTLIALGPGPDPEEREKAREGRPHNAVAVEVHWACATGEVSGV